jgi:hypothetical protein
MEHGAIMAASGRLFECAKPWRDTGASHRSKLNPKRNMSVEMQSNYQTVQTRLLAQPE